MGAPVYGAPWFFSFHISIGIIINVQKGKLWGGTFLACLIRVAYTGSVFTRGFIYNFNINSEEQRGSHFIVSISFLIFFSSRFFSPRKRFGEKQKTKIKQAFLTKRTFYCGIPLFLVEIDLVLMVLACFWSGGNLFSQNFPHRTRYGEKQNKQKKQAFLTKRKFY
jgi:hypothetical protein